MVYQGCSPYKSKQHRVKTKARHIIDLFIPFFEKQRAIMPVLITVFRVEKVRDLT